MSALLQQPQKINMPPMWYFSFKLNIAFRCRWWGALKKKYVYHLFFISRGKNLPEEKSTKLQELEKATGCQAQVKPRR